MPDLNPGPLPHKSGALPMSHHISPMSHLLLLLSTVSTDSQWMRYFFTLSIYKKDFFIDGAGCLMNEVTFVHILIAILFYLFIIKYHYLHWKHFKGRECKTLTFLFLFYLGPKNILSFKRIGTGTEAIKATYGWTQVNAAFCWSWSWTFLIWTVKFP